MGDVNLEIKLNNIDERVIKIEESGGSGGDGYITSVSNDFNVVNKKLSLSNNVTTKLSKLNSDGTLDYSNVKNTPTIPDVSNKIDKPSTANEGQVLTYNGSNWIAGDSGGASSTYNNSVVHPTAIKRMKETWYTVDSVTLPKGTYLAIFSGTLYFTEWAEARFNIKVSNNSIGNDFFEDSSQALYARSGNVIGVVHSEQNITFDFKYYANKDFDEYSYSVNIIKL